MYYRFSESHANVSREVIAESYSDSSYKAAAYQFLQETGQTGSFASAYYGLGTFDLPIITRGKSHTGPVRLILIERLSGSSIRDCLIQNGPSDAGTNAFHYPLEYRLEILALVIESYMR